jgi:adenosylcobinamide-GDP ribazoletransferase
MRRAWTSARLALSSLTIVPVPFREGEVGPAELAASRWWFPAVGALVGLLLAGLSLALDRGHVPAPVAAFLLVLAGVGLTGGLHLDGLADAADGLFLHGGPERRLAVMRDPHVGSFGVLALVFAILGPFAGLVALGGMDRARAVLGAAVVGRCAIVLAAGSASYARPEGTGRIIIDATRLRDGLLAGVVALGVGAGLRREVGLGAAVVGLGLGWSVARLARGRIGGVTGDILGAAEVLSEIGFVIGWSCFLQGAL